MGIENAPTVIVGKEAGKIGRDAVVRRA